jgi:hypothetical protein
VPTKEGVSSQGAGTFLDPQIGHVLNITAVTERVGLAAHHREMLVRISDTTTTILREIFSVVARNL